MKQHRALSAIGIALCAALGTGCASQISALRSDNQRLTQSVSDLRTERRAQERRIRDLQRQLDHAREKLVAATYDDAPPLPVEVAMPKTPPPAPAPSPTAPRVVGVTDDGVEIVYEGDAAAGKSGMPESMLPTPAPRRARADRSERRTYARQSRMPTRERAPDRDGDAATEYRAAVDLVRNSDLEHAIAALRTFVSRHPHHDYADNAQYWLGEAFYKHKNFKQALTEFRAVIETYPRGNKVPDALLKVGYCYLALGKTDKAKAVLEQVVTLYPKSQPAALASKRLETP